MNLSFEIAKQTMMNAQTAMGVVSNNLSNSKIDGYTRQRPNLVTNFAISSGNLYLGTGAVMSSIDRVRTGFYDKQYRDNLGVFSNANAMVTSLSRIETFFGSLDGDTGLKTSIGGFFDALEELSKNPEKTGIKQILKDSGLAMVQSFNLVANNLQTMKGQYVDYTQNKVDDINDALKNLQIVNDEIGRLTAAGKQPNDLLDERDRLLDALSSVMDITVMPGDNNKITLISNGQVLVQDGYCNSLKFEELGDGTVSIKYANGTEFKSTNGELSALVTTLNESIPKYVDKIDTLAVDFMNAFNAIHSKGVAADGTTGVNFFEGTSAADIKLTDDVLNNPSLIGNSSDGAPGNNDIILELIGVKDSKVIDGGQFGVIEFLDNTSAQISAETNSQMVKASNYKYITEEVYKFRANEVGVNEDEEILMSIQLQQTYSAASRIITTINEMFTSLINAI